MKHTQLEKYVFSTKEFKELIGYVGTLKEIKLFYDTVTLVTKK